MSLVRWKGGAPLVSLRAPLGPTPPPPRVLETMQHWANKDGSVYRLPNGYEVHPVVKKPRVTRAKRKYAFFGEP